MASITWTKGYSRADLDRAQERFALTFPDDLIELLRDRRPTGGPDWTNEASIRPLLAWPFEGLLFDVERNGLWHAEWGARPSTPGERADILRDIVGRAPRLIPIFSHRYLPAEPTERGNPVFSVYQSDVICYGADLEDYIDRERDGWDCRPWPSHVKEIRFWSELVRRNGEESSH